MPRADRLGHLLRSFFPRSRTADGAPEEVPLRAELFSAEQMAHHGRALAISHTLGTTRSRNRLLARLAGNEAVLIKTCRLLTEAIQAGMPITPAGEWLLDNFYLIEEQIRTARRHLPKEYSWQLPSLLGGPSAGLPRVYDIALEVIAHGDGQFNSDSLMRFIVAYQSLTPLTLGELWAIPIMLRLALVENLRRVAARLAAAHVGRSKAGYWTDQMLAIVERDPKSLVLVVADMARSKPPASSAFVAELVRRLQGQSPALGLSLTWVEQWLAEFGVNITQLVQAESQHQAVDQVSIANSIGSLRLLATLDWRDFVEAASTVEEVLRQDPGNAYIFMDFATRDQYRHVVEKLARRSRLAETDIAMEAVRLARAAATSHPHDGRRAHVGFYLVGRGKLALESAIGLRAPVPETLRRHGEQNRLTLYLGAIFALTLLLGGTLVRHMSGEGLHGTLLVLFGLLAMICASQLAIHLVNLVTTLVAVPEPLPRMDYQAGIAQDARSIVVIPSLLTNKANIERLVDALEIRYLGNKDPFLHFGLLTDFTDAAEATTTTDALLLAIAAQGIASLNLKYADGRDDVFFLFHRPRRYNANEGMWMGEERKRGKLASLNAFLRGDPDSRFSHVVGATNTLKGVKYVITLDTDTQLPRDCVRQLVATMMHPLNQPIFDSVKKRVVEGYGILQPRIAGTLSAATRSRYVKMLSGEVGLDPYTRTVSDVYQDLFSEGSFIGKGIYEIDAFERSLKDRLPDNRVLSHDLLEGCYARSGLVSDVQLYEDDPASYFVDIRRRHRWIRGDWQIASWVFSRVPGANRKSETNPLSQLSQWKILDNLRRSLVAPALVALLIAGWTVLTPAIYWTAVIVGLVVLLPFLASAAHLAQVEPNVALSHHLRSAGRTAFQRFQQTMFTLSCLPFEAFSALDAIVRTTVRTLVTKRRLLQWTATSDLDSRNGGVAASYRLMWSAPAIALCASIAIIYFRPSAFWVAAPLLALWMCAPAFAWWLSRPLSREHVRLSRKQLEFLRVLARKTWAFFETMVNAGDNWLPPDNFQENPAPVIAHRTSPTNIGLSLLATLAAHDFGYATTGLLLSRTRRTFETLQRLERYRGHFFNWYDTQTLQALNPRYVSSVDSGNLAGHLLVLRQGLLALVQNAQLPARWFAGFADTVAVLRHETTDKQVSGLTALEGEIQRALADRALSPSATCECLHRIAARIDECGEDADGSHHAGAWLLSMRRLCADYLAELEFLAPWNAVQGPPPRLVSFFDVGFCPTLRDLACRDATLADEILRCQSVDPDTDEREWIDAFESFVKVAAEGARNRLSEIAALAAHADDFMAFDYSFLYDPARHLMAIGYNVSDHRRDAGYYDLLASEARLCTFLGIAQGHLPQQSWFALGRILTHAAGEPILLSWSGSMFEYLMPMLVMPSFEHTLLDQTARAAVKRQIEYGRQRGVPWGISESGYNTVDAALNYQYRAFGVPGLGLQRGLAEDLVIAPYATALGLMCAPHDACRNLQRLEAAGCLGQFGMYEAVDYTAARLRRSEDKVIVRSFMAHHQGMTLLSLSHLLLDQPMPRRFASDPLVRATLLLLQERVPRARTLYSNDPALVDLRATPAAPELSVRVFAGPDAPVPAVQLLSNGRYHVMVTAAGGGYSRWKALAVTRWREDTTCDPWGTFCYLRDVATGNVWSPTYAPTNVSADFFEGSFAESRVEFRRRDNFFETHVEIVVSPEDDIELRRLRISNNGDTRRSIDVVSYAEVVLNSPAADALHPAFSNLFVQTEIVTERQAIVCSRRPRAPGDEVPSLLHLMAVHGGAVEDASYETDRSKFIGRLQTVADPVALRSDMPLSNTEGSVLDPIVAIRRRITLDPQQTAIVDVVTGVAEDRARCIALIEKYHDLPLADRAFEMAWTHSQVVLRQLNITEKDAQLYARLSGSIIYAGASYRADGNVIARNRRNQSGLWGYAISGDLPIVLLQIKDPKNIELVRQLVQAHAYWRLKGLMVDLVIWNEERGGYRQQLHDQILGMVAAGVDANVIDRPGGIFLRAAEQISAEDRALLQSVARAIFMDNRGSLAEQVRRLVPTEASIAMLAKQAAPPAPPSTETSRPSLIMDNGFGGFSPDGTEYLVVTEEGQATPAPWVNVLASPHFGCVVSESGSVYTWSENAHEYRLTPWHNDPVTDATGEAFYIRDEDTGRFWSPTPLPRRGIGRYVSCHGFGYSTFEHAEDGIASDLSMFVAPDAPIKFAVLKIRNLSGRARRLSATGYVEWVLGDLRPKTAMHVVTEIDAASGALFARNSYNPEFSENVAFFDVDDVTRTVSGDRGEFIGRNGTLRNPAAMARARLSGKVGAAMDPCAAVQIPFELADGQSREIVFRLGVGRGTEDASRLVQFHRRPGGARATLDAVKAHWQQTLGAVQISTPDQSIDFLANGWLVYQTLGCRMWARSGFYQSGGAYGYRDQLQDAMALVHAAPNLLREHLLRAASRQFVEGDVQHWWHPPLGRGVRSRCSDDFLWLALATCRYVAATGDWDVLTETAPYLEGRFLGQHEESYYDLPTRSAERTSLYQHCVRAIERGLAFGQHGLPLMGSGDWNDGMNNVGAEGQGESVWLGFFLFEILTLFSKLADRHGDSAFARRCQAEAQKLHVNLNAHAWDGRWFRRAYFDDGTPLGSSTNDECQIDSIAQSWSVLSGATPGARASMAMDAVDIRLIDREHGLVQLLAPPFDKSSLNPGYIRGYVPGVRENGGQYTHSAIWAAMAYAKLNDSRRAWEVMHMINPIKHSSTRESARKYRAEPFVVAADIYGVAPHIGRGGWTWYTGSAGWTYRLILESLLGVTRDGDRLRIRPCLPRNWPSAQIRYRFKETIYRIELRMNGENSSPHMSLDGVAVHGDSFAMIDDRQEHAVDVVLPSIRPNETTEDSVAM